MYDWVMRYLLRRELWIGMLNGLMVALSILWLDAHYPTPKLEIEIPVPFQKPRLIA